MFHAVKFMPDVPCLFDRARALAVFGHITNPDAEEWNSFTYKLAQWNDGWKLRLGRETQALDIYFMDAGVLVLWFWSECEFPSEEFETEWQAILGQIPEPLRKITDDPETTTGHRAEGGLELPCVTGVMWRQPRDTSWQLPNFEHPAKAIECFECLRGYSDRPLDEDELRDDRATLVLHDLIMQRPDRFEWSEYDQPTEPADTGMSVTEAVHHILELRPITEQVVQTLNPAAALADIVGAIQSTGYPQSGSRAVPGWYSPDLT